MATSFIIIWPCIRPGVRLMSSLKRCSAYGQRSQSDSSEITATRMKEGRNCIGLKIRRHYAGTWQTNWIQKLCNANLQVCTFQQRFRFNRNRHNPYSRLSLLVTIRMTLVPNRALLSKIKADYLPFFAPLRRHETTPTSSHVLSPLH